ncbi:MAG: 50S ribosomal protein L17 [Christensenellales bacterium]|jgi:large subunit ribosomal protein L17
MAMRKLGRPSDQREAMLRGLTTDLLWYGRIETTQARAKEVRSIAEGFITMAMDQHDKTVEVEKAATDEKGNKVTVKVSNDAPSKLAARRKMMAYLYDIQEEKKPGESRTEYRERTGDIRHPLIEKIFREYGPKYAARREEVGQGGGYTRIIKKGPRRGDAAPEVILELID